MNGITGCKRRSGFGLVCSIFQSTPRVQSWSKETEWTPTPPASPAAADVNLWEQSFAYRNWFKNKLKIIQLSLFVSSWNKKSEPNCQPSSFCNLVTSLPPPAVGCYMMNICGFSEINTTTAIYVGQNFLHGGRKSAISCSQRRWTWCNNEVTTIKSDIQYTHTQSGISFKRKSPALELKYFNQTFSFKWA